MHEKLFKIYGGMLLTGSIYYVGLLVMQYADIYHSWKNWAHPVYDLSTYFLLMLLYALAVLTPLFMFLSGVSLYKSGSIKLYMVIPLIILLAFSGLVGKLLLVVGIAILIFNRIYHGANT